MLGEGGTPLSELQAAIRRFLERDARAVDLKDYRVAIESLEGDFSAVARDAKKAGVHLVGGNITAASWIARTCGMSITSAADRLCVGEQLDSLPKVAAALTSFRRGTTIVENRPMTLALEARIAACSALATRWTAPTRCRWTSHIFHRLLISPRRTLSAPSKQPLARLRIATFSAGASSEPCSCCASRSAR